MLAFFRQQWVADVLRLLAFLPWVVGPGWYVYQALSLPDAVAFGRPVCERYIFIAGTDSVRLLGMEIYTIEPTQGAQIRFLDMPHVVDWGLYSDGLTLEDQEAFLMRLPTDELPEVYMTPPLPTLPSESTTTLTAVGVADDRRCRDRNPDWAEAITSTGTVYHADPSFVTVREIPSFMLQPLILVAGLYVVLFMVVVIAYRRWRSRRKA